MSGTERRDDEYVLGTGNEELARLGFQHQVWAAETTQSWDRAGFGRGQTLIDVGCGPGFATFDLAERVGPEGRVVAIDLSERYVEHLRRQAGLRGVAHVQAHAARVEALDLPEGAADGVFARWVFTFLSDPLRAAQGIARALRPGGRLLVIDYCRYRGFTMAPHHPVFDRVFAATQQSFADRGGNADVARDLPPSLVAAGFRIIAVDPIVRAVRPGEPLWEWPVSFFRIYLPNLVSGGYLEQSAADEFLAEYGRRSADPAAFLLTPPMVAILAEKR
jgi:ubiquinone/menaquinone biosynthesis C-methylase UbiE